MPYSKQHTFLKSFKINHNNQVNSSPQNKSSETLEKENFLNLTQEIFF